MKSQAILTISFILFSVLGCEDTKCDAGKKDTNMILYSDGKMSKISNDIAQQSIMKFEKLFSDCDDMYKLLVTEALIDNLKRTEMCIEIVYSKKRKLRIGVFKSVELNRLLIPLSGRFVSAEQLTFFCGYPEYSSGPLVNKSGFSKIKEELSKIMDNIK